MMKAEVTIYRVQGDNVVTDTFDYTSGRDKSLQRRKLEVQLLTSRRTDDQMEGGAEERYVGHYDLVVESTLPFGSVSGSGINNPGEIDDFNDGDDDSDSQQTPAKKRRCLDRGMSSEDDDVGGDSGYDSEGLLDDILQCELALQDSSQDTKGSKRQADDDDDGQMAPAKRRKGILLQYHDEDEDDSSPSPHPFRSRNANLYEDLFGAEEDEA